MILPFLRIALDKDGLFNGRSPEWYWKESITKLITWLKKNLPDTEEMKKEMAPEQLSIPEEYQPYFNGYNSYYAFLQFTHRGTSSGYYFDWRKYCTTEQKTWIESWYVFNGGGQLSLIESARKLRGVGSMNKRSHKLVLPSQSLPSVDRPSRVGFRMLA